MAQNPIQLTDISEELNKLWDNEQGQNKIRASLFNLILYIQKSERSDCYHRLVKSVISKFPCRVIMMVIDDTKGQEYLRTSVGSETIGEGELKIFCEIIQIEVAGKLVERVPFLILPHILPDLPVYLLWTQDPATESSVLPFLEPLANRMIFDSEVSSDLQRYCKSVLSLMERFHCAIGDLNWSAISGWRSVFSQVFCDPESLSSLAQTNFLRIDYNKSQTQFKKHPEIEAAYLQAWLAAKMNWRFQSIEINEGNIRLSYRNPSKEIIVLLTPEEMDTYPSGTVLSVEVESAKNKGLYCFKRNPQTRQVMIQCSDKDACQLPYYRILSGTSEGQEIIEEIFYPSGGKHYQEMLSILAAIPWRLS